MDAVFALADRITRAGLWPRHRVRRAGGDPPERRGQARLSRRSACGDPPWLMNRLTRRCSKSKASRPATASARCCSACRCRSAAGEMVALMGRNGMGKTTTIRSIMGLTPARAGTIRFGGQEVRKLAVVPDRATRHRAGARGPSDFSQSDRARKSRRRVRQSSRQPPIPGPSKRSTRCFRGSPSAATIWATRCPAASSRCWRSAAR